MERITTLLRNRDIFIFTLLTLIISGASSIGNNQIFRVVFLCLLAMMVKAKNKPLFDRNTISIILIWLFINAISIAYTNSNIYYIQIGANLVNIFISYYILVFDGTCFWRKYEQFLYKMVQISLVFYVLSLIFPSIFETLSTYFRWFADDVYYEKSTQKNYLYMFFFTSTGHDTFRNCGFMFEPGAFAMILIILIGINSLNGDDISYRHIKLYFVALITTFSTAGYLALVILGLIYLNKSKSAFNKVFFILGGIILITYSLDLEWIMPKINSYIKEFDAGETFRQETSNFEEANRLLSAKYLLDKSLILPLGWGISEDQISTMAKNDIVTVNGLFSFLCTWGWPCFIFAMVCIYKFYQRFTIDNKPSISILFAYIATLITLFSNPIQRNPIFFLLILTPIIFKSHKLLRL